MSEEENKRLFKHYTELVDGKIKTSNPVYDSLVKSDAERHLADLIKKNPSLIIKEESNKVVKEESNKPTKSKGKK